jgi:hypothetical protein
MLSVVNAECRRAECRGTKVWGRVDFRTALNGLHTGQGIRQALRLSLAK